MTTPNSKRRPRRFLQFSLRSLLVFVLLVSIGMSWLGARLRTVMRERKIVEVIENGGGIVLYRWNSGRSSLDNFFLGVAFAKGGECDFGDNEAICLKGLPSLTQLTLTGTEITDAGLENVKALSRLRVLSLGGTQVTDEGLEHLKGLTSLESLNLSHTKVTDAGLEHLEGLTNLDYLDLSGTQVTPEGVKKLQQALPECEIEY